MRIVVTIFVLGLLHLMSCKKTENSSSPQAIRDTTIVYVDSLENKYFLYSGNIIHQYNNIFQDTFPGVISVTYNYRSNKIVFYDTMQGRYFTSQYTISKKQNDSEIYYRFIIVRDSLIAWYSHSNSDGNITYSFKGKKK